VVKAVFREAALQGGTDFSRGTVKVTPAIWEQCICADAIIDCFAAYTAAVTHNAFQWAGQPPKLPFSLGIRTPIKYMVP